MASQNDLPVARTMLAQMVDTPTDIAQVPEVLRKMAGESLKVSSVMVRPWQNAQTRARGDAMRAAEVMLEALAANIEDEIGRMLDTQAAADQADRIAGVKQLWRGEDGDALYRRQS